MTESVRVRYAPSPTGIPHVGNVRTALFNWLFARNQGGVFIVRIEDTDQARLVTGATEAILESLAWLGIDWDEGPTGQGVQGKGAFGPYFQSERRELYHREALRLIASGHAYYCYCTAERLDGMRKEQQARKQPSKYDGFCRRLTDAQRVAQDARRVPKVVRLAVPLQGSTSFNDLVRGDITFENALLDDLVLMKSDGFPTYHLANVVDDHHMKISHVMRADEWVSSTPRHMLLYQAFGWTPPLFAHLPMILGPDRSKLSKRHGATSLLEYRDEGFLPESMMNFLALLGWSYDDHTEIMSAGDLTRHFGIERVGKTGAIFNREKLEWMNGVYIRAMTPGAVADRMLPYLEKDLPASIRRPIDRDYLVRIVPLIHERLKVLTESKDLTDFFFMDDVEAGLHALVQKGADSGKTLLGLKKALAFVETAAPFDSATLEAGIRPVAEELGLKTGQLFGSLRFAITGRSVAPPLFHTMEVLGRERTAKRLKVAAKALAGETERPAR